MQIKEQEQKQNIDYFQYMCLSVLIRYWGQPCHQSMKWSEIEQ